MSLKQRLYEKQKEKDKPTVDSWNKRLVEEIKCKEAKTQ